MPGDEAPLGLPAQADELTVQHESLSSGTEPVQAREDQHLITNASCIFCEIIRGREPAHILYENDLVVCFLDIAPLATGHFIVCAKTHTRTLTELPKSWLQAMLPAARKVIVALGMSQYNIICNNGDLAFQHVPHTHVHIIPKTDRNNGLQLKWQRARKPKEKKAERLEAVAAELRASIPSVSNTGNDSKDIPPPGYVTEVSLKALDSCVFCGIVATKVPGHVVYRTDTVCCFLDLDPLDSGHTLIIPAQHAHKFHHVPDQVLQDILPACQVIVHALKLEVDSYHIIQNNGPLAFQHVGHVHFHLIPKRSSKKGLKLKTDLIWDRQAHSVQGAATNDSSPFSGCHSLSESLELARLAKSAREKLSLPVTSL